MIDFEKILYKVTKTHQYIGNEVLSVKKTSYDTDIVLVFPDKYEVGASNLGQRILYDIINKQNAFFADRAYAPEADCKDVLSEEGVLLCGLNSRKPLKDFDFVGFSIQYEMAYPTVLKILELGGIPYKRTERDDSFPLILAGGPCTYNPFPLVDFVDMFLIGDGEEVIVEILEKSKELKNKKLTKLEKLKEYAKIEGIFIPALYDCTKIPAKPLYDDVPAIVNKRIVQMTAANLPTEYPVSFSTSIHDRAVIEIRRGCGRMCRFCQPGHVTLPVRERNAKEIIEAAKKLLKNTGYDEYSLLSLSSNDYTNIESVIEELNCSLAHKGISASLPSQRIDKFSTKLANLIQEVRKSTLTLAPEAGSQRLRDVINKNITEEQIINAALSAYENGFHQLKFYFIFGLPTETNEDLDELIELLAKIRAKADVMRKERGYNKNLSITCTLSIFVPKPFTPFQWEGQATLAEISAKTEHLRAKAEKLKGVRLKYHDRAVSQIEAVLTRGGVELNKYIEKLYKKGAYLDGWNEHFSWTLWQETAQECGISLDELASKKYDVTEPLVWDVIDCGITKEWFLAEYKKALDSKASVPCEVKCSNCGVCKKFGVRKIIDEKYSPKIFNVEFDKSTVYKYRIKITKKGTLRFLSHLDWQNTVLKALNKTDLHLVFSQGFNPIPKVSLGIALPLFVESECELIDIELYDKFDGNELKKILQEVMPENAIVKSVKMIDTKELAIDHTIQWAEYEFVPIINNSQKGLFKKEKMLYIKDKIFSDNEIFIKKKNKKGIENIINIRNSIKKSGVENSLEDGFRVILKTGQNTDLPSVRPDVLIANICSDVMFKIRKTRIFDLNMNEL